MRHFELGGKCGGGGRGGEEGGVSYDYEKLNQTVCCWHVVTQSCYLY